MHNYFFFSSRRRHTRSKRDWSSDVCSSDLKRVAQRGLLRDTIVELEEFTQLVLGPHRALNAERSEERRVGKECRSRWSPDHEKKKRIKKRVTKNRSYQEHNQFNYTGHHRTE